MEVHCLSKHRNYTKVLNYKQIARRNEKNKMFKLTKLIIITATFLFSFSTQLWADEAKDINTCMSAAYNYADQTIDDNKISYDGGWLSSTVSWTGTTKVHCNVSGKKINKLLINGEAVIIDGFAGVESKTFYDQVSKEIDRLEMVSNRMISLMRSDLDVLEGKLKLPKPEITKLKEMFNSALTKASLRIEGSDEELAKALNNRLGINENEVRPLKEAIEKNEVKPLKESNKNNKNENSQKDSKPIEPFITQVHELIKNEDFITAKELLSKIVEHPDYDKTEMTKFIETTLKVVKPISGKEIKRNLNAYKFLYELSDGNEAYLNKVNLYEQKLTKALAEQKNQKEISRILKYIKVSDDLNLYRNKMALAALKLNKSGKCTNEQLIYYGGWVKSGQRKGQYFMDCGKTRYWFNPKDGSNSIKTDKHFSESNSRKACTDYILREVTGAKIQPFNNNYTKHTIGSVTYVQGFKVKNIQNQTLKYNAFCVIQSDRTMEVNIALQ